MRHCPQEPSMPSECAKQQDETSLNLCRSICVFSSNGTGMPRDEQPQVNPQTKALKYQSALRRCRIHVSIWWSRFLCTRRGRRTKKSCDGCECRKSSRRVCPKFRHAKIAIVTRRPLKTWLPHQPHHSRVSFEHKD